MDFGDTLRELLDENSISVPELSRRTGINKNTLYSYLRRNTKKPDPAVLGMIADALKVDVNVFLKTDLHATFDPALSSVTPAAKKLRALGERLSQDASVDPDRAALLDIYDGMNERGRQTLMDVARGLAANPDMKKVGESNDETTA